jgi:hypothetical protein
MRNQVSYPHKTMDKIIVLHEKVLVTAIINNIQICRITNLPQEG